MGAALQTPPSRSAEPVVRRLWWSERPLWRQHLKRLSPRARRDRFSGVVSESFIDAYCDGVDPFSLALFGAFVDGVLRAVGEFVVLDGAWPRRAELAFSVEDAWQNRGLGSALFRRLVLHARNQMVRRVYIVSESGNARMHRIARKHAMRLSEDDGELSGRLELQGPSYLSVMSELLDEGLALYQQAPGFASSAPGT